MLCCVSSGSTVDDGISATSEEGRQRIVPGFTRPESELDWEEITVFQWPNDEASEAGFQRPASTIGSQAAENIARQHQARLAAANKAKQSNNIAPVQPANKPKKKQGLFAKNSKKNRSAPGPPGEGERLPGDLNRPPPPPPLPPGRDDLPHITARRVKSQTDNNENTQEERVNGSAPRQAIPLHGNFQLNFSVPVEPVSNNVTLPESDGNERGVKKRKGLGSKRSTLSLFRRPTFLSDSAFGTKKKKKSTKAYPAPPPPAVHPPSSIDTGITEGRLPMGDKMPYENPLGTIKEPQHWEQTEFDEGDEELYRDRSPSDKLVGKYDPKNYINKVPLQDASGNELPQWKRLLIAKQFAEKDLTEAEEKAMKEEEEKKFKDMPGWKRAILEKKEAENRAKREREEQDIAAIEWAKRNPTQSMALDEDGLPMTPWQAELRERKDSKSSSTDRSRPTSTHSN